MNLSQPATTPAGTSGAIWNPNATANWSLLFTPAFGAYLQMLNWRVLGEAARAERSRNWFYASIGLVLVFLLTGVLAPKESAAHGAARGLGLVFLLSWYFTSEKSQANYVKAKFGTNYPHQSWGKVLLYAFGALLGLFVLGAVLGIVLGTRGT